MIANFKRGELKKLTIHKCNVKFGILPGKDNVYTVLVNPEQITENTKLVFGKVKGAQKNEKPKYHTKETEKLTIKILFDGTGVLKPNSFPPSLDGIKEGFKDQFSINNKKESVITPTVTEQIKSFKKLTGYDGKLHQISFLKVIWGDITFDGRLISFNLTYSLFNRDGTPLRATATCVFEEDLDPETIKARNADESPDMTHIRIVNEGDTLPLMCNRIYQKSELYMEVARVNGLANYRSLTVGSKLVFPPIKEITQ